MTAWCVVCMLLLCMHSFAAGKAAAVVAPRAVSRARCVRPYSLFGNLFGTKAAKAADMGSAASKAGAENSREGWAPSSGMPHCAGITAFLRCPALLFNAC
eukprot:GHRQ01034317.1.p1 GENE.GHRQ01034317.1~~GHRQ01034317.1.p1  ORF type:complete len:100 (-),score=20.93 GHRQ01034317.1:496-795(-)